MFNCLALAGRTSGFLRQDALRGAADPRAQLNTVQLAAILQARPARREVAVPAGEAERVGLARGQAWFGAREGGDVLVDSEGDLAARASRSGAGVRRRPLPALTAHVQPTYLPKDKRLNAATDIARPISSATNAGVGKPEFDSARA